MIQPDVATLYNLDELKSLSRIRFKKLKTLSQAKMEYTRLLMIKFPEFVKYYDHHAK